MWFWLSLWHTENRLQFVCSQNERKVNEKESEKEVRKDLFLFPFCSFDSFLAFFFAPSHGSFLSSSSGSSLCLYRLSSSSPSDICPLFKSSIWFFCVLCVTFFFILVQLVLQQRIPTVYSPCMQSREEGERITTTKVSKGKVHVDEKHYYRKQYCNISRSLILNPLPERERDAKYFWCIRDNNARIDRIFLFLQASSSSFSFHVWLQMESLSLRSVLLLQRLLPSFCLSHVCLIPIFFSHISSFHPSLHHPCNSCDCFGNTCLPRDQGSLTKQKYIPFIFSILSFVMLFLLVKEKCRLWLLLFLSSSRIIIILHRNMAVIIIIQGDYASFFPSCSLWFINVSTRDPFSLLIVACYSTSHESKGKRLDLVFMYIFTPGLLFL